MTDAVVPDGRFPGATRFAAQSRAVAGWKVAEYAGLAAFTILLPRSMGPATFGRFAALLSLIGLLTMAAAMGAQATFGRFVPEFAARGDTGRIRGLFTLLFGLRAMVAGVLAGVLLLFFPRLLPGATPAMAVFGAGAFVAVALAMVCYQLLYGLNQLGRSLAHDGLIRLVVIGLVVALGALRDVDRAALALFLGELAFLALGLAWTRGYFAAADARRHRGDLAGQLGFGLTFFAANLLLLAVWRGGELAVLYLSGDSAEVAYYSIASAIAMAFAALIGQLSVLTVPSLTRFHVTGEPERTEHLLGLVLKYLTILAFTFLLVVHTLGGWLVERLLGEVYRPVAANLEVLAVALLPIALVRTGFAIAMVRKQERRALGMAAGGLAVFVALGIALVPASGSRGAAVAAAGAMAGTGVIGAFALALWPALRAARFGRLVASGVLAGMVFTLPWGSLPVLGAVAAAVFGSALFASGVVGAEDVRRLSGAVVS